MLTEITVGEGIYGNYTFSAIFYKPKTTLKKSPLKDFPGGAVVKNTPANAGDTGSSPGPARSHMPRSN